MPRGRAVGYDTQREQILARAAQLFAEQGFPGTSMNQVAKACGVSKPTLYHYVRDKVRLLFEITDNHVQRLLALVHQVEEQKLPPERRLRELIVRFVEAYAGAQAAHRVLTEDVKFLDPTDRDRVVDAQRKVVAAFASAVAAVRPELRATHLHKPLAMLLFGMINWMFTWLRSDGRLGYAEMAPIVADLYFGGLAAVRAPRERVRRAAARQAPRAIRSRSAGRAAEGS